MAATLPAWRPQASPTPTTARPLVRPVTMAEPAEPIVIPTRRATAEAALDAIVEAFGVSREEVRGRSRFAHIIEARHAWWSVLRLQRWSYPAIAREAGVDHSTVMVGVKKTLAKWAQAGGRVGDDVGVR